MSLTHYKEFENYPLTVIVCTKEFAKKNPTLIKNFLDEYKKSLENTLNHPKIAAEYTQKHELGLNAQIVEKIIPIENNMILLSMQPSSFLFNEIYVNIIIAVTPLILKILNQHIFFIFILLFYTI